MVWSVDSTRAGMRVGDQVEGAVTVTVSWVVHVVFRKREQSIRVGTCGGTC